MDRVDKYKRIEDDQQQGKEKAKVAPQERRDFRSDRYNKTDREGIMQSRQCQIAIKWSELYSENQYIKYWKKSRTSPSSNGPIRWWEILKSETETSIVNTIGIMAIQRRIARVYGITWINLPEKENWNSCCTILAGSVNRPLLGLKEKFLQDPLWELSMLFLQYLAEQDHVRLE